MNGLSFCAQRFVRQAGLALLAVTVLISPAWAQPSQITNPPSQFEITVDGLFQPNSEWSDVTPAAFMSPPTSNGGPAIPTSLSDPTANSLLYAAIAPGAEISTEGLYLMYDYLPRTQALFTPGEFIADIRFPMSIAGNEQFIIVQVRGSNIGQTLVAQAVAIGGADFLIDLDDDGDSEGFASQFGIEGALDFGTTPNDSSFEVPETFKTLTHMMIELEVPLLISADFAQTGSFFPPNGVPGNGNGSGYDPDPAFWGSDIANDLVDPPASAAIFQILPDGSTIVRPILLPEPSAFGTMGFALVALVGIRRRAKKSAHRSAI